MKTKLIAFLFTLIISLSAHATSPRVRLAMSCSNPTGTLTYTEKNYPSSVFVQDQVIAERVWRYNMLVENDFLYRIVMGKETDFMGRATKKASSMRATFLEVTPISDDGVGKKIFAQRIKLNPGVDGWYLEGVSVTQAFVCSEQYLPATP